VKQWITGPITAGIGILALAGVMPGDVATGPRIGIGMLMLTIGLLIVAIPTSKAILRKTTRPADYDGRCPVGEACPKCEAFNYKPRRQCRLCATPVNAPDQA
jgi:hypothetical protein